MENHRAGRCRSCGAREPVLRAVYDWRRSQRNGAWVWLGDARVLCTSCFADPRLRARWIDERQKQTPAKPMWAKDEPEEFAVGIRAGAAGLGSGGKGDRARRSRTGSTKGGKPKPPMRRARKRK